MHVPVITTQEGLLNVLSVGCVLEYTTPLSRARYEKGYDYDSDAARALRLQENQAREFFRVLMKVFGTKYMVFAREQLVDVSQVWQEVLVRFAVAVVNLMKEKAGVTPRADGVNTATVTQALRNHLGTDHPHLLPPFEKALAATVPMTLLTWPCEDWPLRIVPKSPSLHHLLRAMNLAEHPAFSDTEIPLQPEGE